MKLRIRRLVIEKTFCGSVVKKTWIISTIFTLFALDVEAGTQEGLEACRQEIDSLDQRRVKSQKGAPVVKKWVPLGARRGWR